MSVPTDGYTGSLVNVSVTTEDDGNPGWVLYRAALGPLSVLNAGADNGPTQTQLDAAQALYDQFIADLRDEMLSWGTGGSTLAGDLGARVTRYYTGTKEESEPFVYPS